MAEQSDFKKMIQVDESAEISYRYPDGGQPLIGICLNISGTGILFRAEQSIERGKALEIVSVGQNALTPSYIAYVEVIQSNELRSGLYEVTTEIKGIREV